MRDPRVRTNQSYLVIILLARVVTQARRDLRDVNPGVIENLFSADLAFLQDLYQRVKRDRFHR